VTTDTTCDIEMTILDGVQLTIADTACNLFKCYCWCISCSWSGCDQLFSLSTAVTWSTKLWEHDTRTKWI